jgi:hypothetical protein
MTFAADLSTMTMSMIYDALSPSSRAMTFAADFATATMSMIHVSLSLSFRVVTLTLDLSTVAMGLVPIYFPNVLSLISRVMAFMVDLSGITVSVSVQGFTTWIKGIRKQKHTFRFDLVYIDGISDGCCTNGGEKQTD